MLSGHAYREMSFPEVVKELERLRAALEADPDTARALLGDNSRALEAIFIAQETVKEASVLLDAFGVRKR